MKNLYTPEVVFKTQKKAIKWFDDEEYKKEYKKRRCFNELRNGNGKRL